METIGYFCDECRLKYVRHSCKDGLPCGHPFADAVMVYAKHYSKSGQTVVFKWGNIRGDYNWPEYDHGVRLWIERNNTDWNYEFWANSITVDAGEESEKDERIPLGIWLRKQELKIIRAYTCRWDSWKTPPEWRRLMQIPEDADIWEYLKSDEERLNMISAVEPHIDGLDRDLIMRVDEKIVWTDHTWQSTATQKPGCRESYAEPLKREK